MAFRHMENIGFFLEAATTLGAPTTSLFQTVDLYGRLARRAQRILRPRSYLLSLFVNLLSACVCLSVSSLGMFPHSACVLVTSLAMYAYGTLGYAIACAENANMGQVLVCLQALSRAVTENGYSGPTIDLEAPSAT